MLNSGVELAISPRLVEGLSEARPDQLDQIEVSPSGLGLHFPKLDADLYVPALLECVLGSRSWMASRMRCQRQSCHWHRWKDVGERSPKETGKSELRRLLYNAFRFFASIH
ncbi:DUF2442 domain-containing protein [Pseudomonas viridiflava]|uniref:DUF2442 domain-containing protein n=1 Tax=Pseudomonas viridiflava TaxID=33069 RepID=UPI000EFA7DE1|nr:DUF2442 domain-containing protein [Pseudomonas viridiflava]